VLKLYPANHLWNFEQMAKTGWPVGDGQTGIVAGDQPAGNDQQEGQRGNKHSKPMLSGVIRGRGQNCSLRVLIILALVFPKSRALRGIAFAKTVYLEQMAWC
jgi:hypothetical protein